MNRKLIQEDSGQQCMCESSLEGRSLSLSLSASAPSPRALRQFNKGYSNRMTVLTDGEKSSGTETALLASVQHEDVSDFIGFVL